MSKPSGEPASPGMIKAPNSLRVAQIVVGAITLVLAGAVLASPGFAMILVVFWLSLSLLFGGIESLITGMGARHLSRGWRAFSIGAGAVAIALSLAVIAFPAAAVLTSVLLLAIALLFLGAGGIAKGLSEKRMVGWARGMLVAVGAVTVGLSIPVMIFPTFGLYTLYVFVAASLVVNGAVFVIAGITGAIFRPVGIGLGAAGRRFWESDAA